MAIIGTMIMHQVVDTNNGGQHGLLELFVKSDLIDRPKLFKYRHDKCEMNIAVYPCLVNEFDYPISLHIRAARSSFISRLFRVLGKEGQDKLLKLMDSKHEQSIKHPLLRIPVTEEQLKYYLQFESN